MGRCLAEMDTDAEIFALVTAENVHFALGAHVRPSKAESS